MVEYAYKENGVMKLKPVALSLSQSEIDEIATELLEAMQPDWQNAVQLTVAQLDAGYVCPSDGYLCLNFLIQGSANAFVSITVNDIGIATAWNATNQSALSVGQAQCQVNKGDVVRTFYSTGVSIAPYGYNPFHFVPFKTSNPVSLRPLDPHKIDTAILNHWDDITGDFSTTGSTAGIVLNYVKYNPVLRMLKYKVTRNQSTAANSTEKHELIYNGSEMIVFSANSTILLESINFVSTITAGYEVSSKIMSSNHIEVNAYNRNGGNTWESGHYFTGVIYL